LKGKSAAMLIELELKELQHGSNKEHLVLFSNFYFSDIFLPTKLFLIIVIYSQFDLIDIA